MNTNMSANGLVMVDNSFTYAVSIIANSRNIFEVDQVGKNPCSWCVITLDFRLEDVKRTWE